VAIDYAKLKNWPFKDVEQSYTEKDSMLYALGIGVGFDPTDERQLAFVYEKNLKALPTMAAVLAHPGFWMKDPTSGIDWLRVLHGEHSLTLQRPLPVAATVVGRTRIRAVVDKGVGKGALVVWERTLHDCKTGDLLATIDQVTFCRGDGGFSEVPGNGPAGGDPAPAARPAAPEGMPDAICVLPTLPQAALIYRLCADPNPLHVDPAVAKAAGFARPILHGLATFGVAGHAILKTYCNYDPALLVSLSARFSAPVFPGETIRCEMWRRGDRLQFRARVLERDTIVLSHGTARIG
jgi:acyl dehydratase